MMWCMPNVILVSVLVLDDNIMNGRTGLFNSDKNRNPIFIDPKINLIITLLNFFLDLKTTITRH